MAKRHELPAGFNEDGWNAILKIVNEYIDEQRGYGTAAESTPIVTFNNKQMCLEQLCYNTQEYARHLHVVGAKLFAAENLDEYLNCAESCEPDYIRPTELPLDSPELFDLVVQILTQAGWTGMQLATLTLLLNSK